MFTKSLSICLGFILFSASCQFTQIHAATPNIILIMVDDMGAEGLPSYGGLEAKTPNIDQLIKKGIRFTNCYSTPLCTPSRVQIMTGKYNHRNYREFGFLDPKEKTFGHLLQDAGYKTCIVGKWQLNGVNSNEPGNQDSMRPLKTGFDEYCLWQVTKRKSSRYKDPVIEQNGKFLGVQKGKYGPDIFCDYACDFMERNRNQPFFLYFPMVLTHSPFVPTPDSPDWNDNKINRKKEPLYFTEMIEYTDQLVGRIHDKLESLNLLENTIVLYTADNGTHRSLVTKTRNGPVRGGKGTTLSTGIHVPLIAYGKGVTPAGSVCENLIDFTDILPTLLDIAGQKVPSEFVTDGHSFYPVLKGETGSPRESIFCHYDARWPFADLHRTRFAMNKQYKLYHDGRMYDYRNDPDEKNPLSQAQMKQLHTEMASLQKVLDSVEVPWDPSEPDYPLKRESRKQK